MSRSFKIIQADGFEMYAIVTGDQPDPVAPVGGSVEELDEPYVLPPVEPTLDGARLDAWRLVDAAAEAARGRVLPLSPGLALVYVAKWAEVAGFISGDEGPFPLLEAEVGITAPDLAGVVAIVRAKSDEWILVAAAIERVRLKARAAIVAAGSVEEINWIVDNTLGWPV